MLSKCTFYLVVFLCFWSITYAQIPTNNLALWLKADAGALNSTLNAATNNSNVRQWTDQSGNSNTAIQTTSNSQPTYITNAINNKPALRFKASEGDVLLCANSTSLNPTAFTIFIVGTYGVGGNGSWETFLMKAVSSSWTNGGYGISRAGGNNAITSWVNSYSGNNSAQDVSAPTGTPVLLSVRYQQGSLQCFTNGNQAGSTLNAPAITHSNGSLRIGNGEGSYGLNGDIAEIIMYGSALSVSDRETVEDYLRTKYGITQNTPAPAHWTQQTSGTSQSLLACHAPSANAVYAVGSVGYIRKSTDGGTTWTNISNTPQTLGAVNFFTDSLGIAVGNGGTIQRTTDGGTTWTQPSSPTSNELWGVSFGSSNVVVAVGGLGTIIRSTDGGVTWNSVNSGTTNNFWAVSMANATDGIAVGYQVVKRTTDGGATWTNVTGVSQYDLRGVAFKNNNIAYAVGTGNGIIVKSTDGGISWTQLPSITSASLYAVSFNGTDNGLAAGDNGTILRTNNGGSSWVVESTPVSANLRGITYPSSALGVAIGFSGTILRSTSPTAISEAITSIKQLNIYPNPTNDIAHITLELTAESNTTITVMDLQGREALKVFEGSLANGQHQINADLSALENGIYICMIKTNNVISTSRIVVAH